MSVKIHAPLALLPGEQLPPLLYTLERELGGSQSRSVRYGEVKSVCDKNRTRVVQPVASHRTDWVTFKSTSKLLRVRWKKRGFGTPFIVMEEHTLSESDGSVLKMFGCIRKQVYLAKYRRKLHNIISLSLFAYCCYKNTKKILVRKFQEKRDR